MTTPQPSKPSNRPDEFYEETTRLGWSATEESTGLPPSAPTNAGSVADPQDRPREIPPAPDLDLAFAPTVLDASAAIGALAAAEASPAPASDLPEWDPNTLANPAEALQAIDAAHAPTLIQPPPAMDPSNQSDKPTTDNEPHSVREDIPVQPLSPEAAARHYRQISRLIQAAVAVSVAMTILGGSSLFLLDPALAPWFIGTSALMLANAALWNWIIRGAFQVQGASRRLLIRGIIAKVFLIASVLVLVLVLRPDTQPTRLATLAGLLTPLIGLLIASILPRPRD